MGGPLLHYIPFPHFASVIQFNVIFYMFSLVCCFVLFERQFSVHHWFKGLLTKFLTKIRNKSVLVVIHIEEKLLLDIIYSSFRIG